MLQPGAELPSFLGPRPLPLRARVTFFSPFVCREAFGLLPRSPSCERAAVNVGVQTPPPEPAFSSLGIFLEV